MDKSRQTLSAEIGDDYIPFKPDNAQVPMQIKLDDLIKTIEDQKFPPVERWEPDFCGDIDMRIAADGSWHYMGTPIGRERMVRLFSTVLRKDDDGKTYLVTPVEKLGIAVDDAPFIATQLAVIEDQSRGQVLSFTTNVGDTVIVDREHPLWVVTDPATGEPRPYVRVRGRLDALIARPVFYELVERAETIEEDGERFLHICSAGQSFRLGALEEAAGDDA